MAPPKRNAGGAPPPARRRNNARGGGCCRQLKSPGFRHRAGIAIGCIQLGAGVAAVVLSWYSLRYYHWNIIDYPKIKAGIWAGAVAFIPAGVLGIAAMKKNTCIIALYMLWCIFAAFVGPMMTLFEGVVAGVGSLVFACKSLLGPIFKVPLVRKFVDESICENFGIEEAVIIHGILAFIGLIEFVVAVVGSAFCCDGLCCGVSVRVAPHGLIV